MRRISRARLDRVTSAELTKLSAKVKAAPDRTAEAERLWRDKPRGPFKDVRSALEKMASGRARCMYCEDSFGTDIEHYYP